MTRKNIKYRNFTPCDDGTCYPLKTPCSPQFFDLKVGRWDDLFLGRAVTRLKITEKHDLTIMLSSLTIGCDEPVTCVTNKGGTDFYDFFRGVSAPRPAFFWWVFGHFWGVEGKKRKKLGGTSFGRHSRHGFVTGRAHGIA